MADAPGPAVPPPDELAARRKQRYRWETLMDAYTHPRCRCIPLPPPPDTRPWYARSMSWLRVKLILWRLRRG